MRCLYCGSLAVNVGEVSILWVTRKKAGTLDLSFISRDKLGVEKYVVFRVVTVEIKLSWDVRGIVLS